MHLNFFERYQLYWRVARITVFGEILEISAEKKIPGYDAEADYFFTPLKNAKCILY
jgi:hypothetical protein